MCNVPPLTGLEKHANQLSINMPSLTGLLSNAPSEVDAEADDRQLFNSFSQQDVIKP
jgi:hypothetical protein